MEDIGVLYKARFLDAEKSPRLEVWERINDTLDEELKRKKRIFFWWFFGSIATVTILLITTLTVTNISLFNASEIDGLEEIHVQTEVPMENTSEEAMETSKMPIENGENQNNFTLIPSEGIEENQTSKENEILHTNDKKSETATSKNGTSVTSQGSNTTTKKGQKIQLEGDNEVIFDDGYEVETNYSYYNSETNETIITKDKRVIDSLIAASKTTIKKTEITDTMTEKEKRKDSLK